MTTPRTGTEPERRVIQEASGVELRANNDGSYTLTGYAAVFNELSKPVRGAFREKIAPGCFARALRERQDVVATENHDAHHVLGRTGSGTLTLAEDARGLRVECTLPKTTYADNLREKVRRKDVRGMSFMFTVTEGGERWELRGSASDGLDVRVLTDVNLLDVSVCTFPMYDETTVAVRSFDQWRAGAMPEQRNQSGLGLRGGAAMPPWDDARVAEWQRRHPGERRSCFWSHLGLYAMHAETLNRMAVLAANGALAAADPFTARAAKDDGPGYELTDAGVAVVRIKGPMKKERSKFGGCSTVETRKRLRAARDSHDVLGILLHIESPGGHVEGTVELANEVRAARKRKPVHAYIEGMGASAAMWVACQASRITANTTAQVGSIGVLAVLHDVSGAFEKSGIKVHVVASGAMKGAGTPGTEITDEHLAEVRDYVGAVWSMFREAVMTGRKFSDEQMAAVGDGRVHIAAKAEALGLLDGVGTMPSAERGVVEAATRRGGVKSLSLADAQRRQRQAAAQLAGAGLAATDGEVLAVVDDELGASDPAIYGLNSAGARLLDELRAQDDYDDGEDPEELREEADALGVDDDDDEGAADPDEDELDAEGDELDDEDESAADPDEDELDAEGDELDDEDESAADPDEDELDAEGDELDDEDENAADPGEDELDAEGDELDDEDESAADPDEDELDAEGDELDDEDEGAADPDEDEATARRVARQARALRK